MGQLGAAVQLGDFTSNAVRLIRDIATEPEAVPGYNVLNDLTPAELVVADEFAFVDSPTELARVRRQRQNFGALERRLASGPLNPVVASLAAALVDPTTYLSGGAAVVGKTATTGQRLRRAGSVVALENAAHEATLQAAQRTRSLEESASAIIMGGALGFGLGGAGAALAGRAGRTPEVKQAYEAAVDDMTTLMRADQETSVGAMVRPERPAGHSELASSFGVAEIVGNIGRAGDNAIGQKVFVAPAVELMQSPSPTMRTFTQRLVDTGLLDKGAFKGDPIPQSVDIAIRSQQQEIIGKASRLARLSHKAYVAAGGKLNQQEFYEQVGKAVRFPARITDQRVLDLAETFRTNVFARLSKEAKQFIPGFSEIAEKDGWRYLTRIYRRDRIAAEIDTFRGVVARWFMKTNQATDLEDAEDMAQGVIDRILGNDGGRTDLIMAPPSKRGPTKERVFDIPDELIEPWLESNIMDVAGRYVRTLTADIEFGRAFQDLGDPMDPFKGVAKKIRDEWQEKIDAAEPNQRKKLNDQMNRELQTAEELVRRVRGIEPAPLKGIYGLGLKVGRDLTATRALGSVVASSVTDLGRVSMQEGVTRVWGTLLADMAQGFRGIKMGIRDAQEMGAAWDLELNTRARALFDVDETVYGQSWLDRSARGSGRLVNAFMRATGMPHWNQFWKGTASSLASTRILRAAEKAAAGKPLTKFERLRAAQSGLSEADLRAMAAEAQHFQRYGPIRLANIGAWGNQEMARKFRNAILRDVDDAIITPGPGDIPLTWSGNALAKSMTQFKRFGMSANHRVLIAGLQRRDTEAMGGLASMVGLGAVATMLKDIVNRGEIQERSPREWAVDAIDRSGVLSLYTELEAMAPRSIRPSTLASGEVVSRFAERDIVDQIAGPSARLASDLGQAVAGFADGTVTQSDARRAAKLLPFSNHFLISHPLDEMTRNLGLPERQSR